MCTALLIGWDPAIPSPHLGSYTRALLVSSQDGRHLFVAPWFIFLAYCVINVHYEPLIQRPNSWTYNFAEISGHNLESSQTWGFLIYNVTMFTLQTSFTSLLLKVKFVSRGDCELQRENLVGPVSPLRPRIRPQFTQELEGTFCSQCHVI
jgi:hypothetical protein